MYARRYTVPYVTVCDNLPSLLIICIPMEVVVFYLCCFVRVEWPIVWPVRFIPLDLNDDIRFKFSLFLNCFLSFFGVLCYVTAG